MQKQLGLAKKVMVAALSLSLAGGPLLVSTSQLALAETSSELQSKLDSAKKTLEDLYDQAESASEQLNATQAKLDDIQKQIDDANNKIAEIEAKLSVQKETLKKQVAADYTSGGVNLLSIVLGSNDLGDVISNIYIANKVSEARTQNINEILSNEAQIKSEKTKLEQSKSEQQQLLESQKQQQQELQAKAQDAKSYVDSLSSDLREALQKEEEQRQAQQAQAAASAINQAREQAQSGNQNSQPSNSSNNSSSNTQPSKPSNGGSSSGSSNSGTLAGWRSVVVAAAYSKIGFPYVWGAKGPNSFDCSGFTAWCYAQAGISITSYSEAQKAFANKPISQAQPGDVVYRYNHVGIYVGNGVTIEAHDPSSGVGYGSLSRFVSAGAPR